MPRHANFVEELVSEVTDALKDAETNIRREWHWAKGEWSQSQTSNDFRSARTKFKNVPNRVSDFATDGSCLMRYMFAYSTKGFGALMGLGGLITTVVGLQPGRQRPDHRRSLPAGVRAVRLLDRPQNPEISRSTRRREGPEPASSSCTRSGRQPFRHRSRHRPAAHSRQN